MRMVTLLVLLIPVLSTADVTPWVDIELSNGHLYVGTEIAGIPGRALIDTGAQLNGINEHFLNDAGITFPKGKKIKMQGVHGTSDHNTYREVPVRIFGADLEFTDLVGFRMGPPENQIIIGAGFLKLLVFQFDYPNQRMRAISRDSIDLEELRNVESRKDPQGGSPIIKVRLNDEKDVWLLMDTGNNGGVLIDRPLANKQKWLSRFATVDSKVTGINSSGETERLNLPVMTLGEFEIENPIIIVPAEGEKFAFFGPDRLPGSRNRLRKRKMEGILGYDVLRHFVVTVDYKEGYVHIEPGSSSAADRE